MFLLAVTNPAAQALSKLSCPVTVRAEVLVKGPSVSLADLLQPDACAELFGATAGVRLGAKPLAGSPRVMEGGAVRALLQHAADARESLRNRGLIFNVPERITLRSASQVPPLAFEAGARRTNHRPYILVKAGQSLELLWDHGGIRLKIRAICLEAGQAGETVRVRFAQSGRVLRAIVLPDGTLRADS